MGKIRVLVISALIVVFVLTRSCYSSLFFSYTHALSSCFVYPLLRVQHYSTQLYYDFFKKRSTIAELQSLTEKLHKENQTLKNEHYAYQALLQQSNALADLMVFKKRYERTSEKRAQILVRHLSTEYQFFLVNAGARDGIEKDMVALYGNALLGKVVEVYPWYCKVILITDACCSVAALCTQAEVKGILEGINQERAIALNFVSHLAQVHEGDLVISSGEGLIFPQGFALGTIVACEKGDLVYTIQVKPCVDLRAVDYCTLSSKADLER